MSIDPIKNFGKVTVSDPHTSTDTIIGLNTGDGDKLPNPSIDGQYNLVWWNSTDFSDPSDDPNKEIVRVIGKISPDTLQLNRHQENTIATDKNLIGKTYKMILTLTSKMIPDIQSDSQSRVDTHSALTANVHNFDSSGRAPAQTHGNERHTENYVTALAGWNIYFINTPSTNIKISNDVGVGVPYTWTKLKTITFTDGFYGTVRIYWTIYNSGLSSEETYSQIYKNGIAFGPSHHVYPAPYSVPSTEYDDLTISMNPGDTLEIWANAQFGPSYTTINNFRIAYDTSIIPRTTNT